MKAKHSGEEQVPDLPGEDGSCPAGICIPSTLAAMRLYQTLNLEWQAAVLRQGGRLLPPVRYLPGLSRSNR